MLESVSFLDIFDVCRVLLGSLGLVVFITLGIPMYWIRGV